MENNKDVSVIIPVFNDSHKLNKCLQSLNEQTYPKEKMEIIVVDNGSSDDPKSVVGEFDQVILLEEKKVGSYAARNKGIKFSNCSILAFIDSDCVADRRWLENGIEVLRELPQDGLVGGRVDFLFLNPKKPNAVEIYDSITSFRQKEYIEIHKFSVTGNLFTTRKVVEKVGLFNSDMKSGGDHEWGNKVHDAGFILRYADDVIVSHPARHRLSDIYKKARRVAGGNSQKSGKNVRRGALSGLIGELTPPFRRIRTVFTNPKINGVRMKFKVVSVLITVKYVSVYERMRLILGLPPSRS